jgi:hypothetical protein
MNRRLPFAAAALTCLAGLLAPEAAAAPKGSCLPPTGGDDTAVLQAALDRCSGAGQPCSVDLCAGVFDTGILRVADFRGTLRGAGARATVLRALPNLQVTKQQPDFFRADPLDPDSDPWPYLLQFVEGGATLRDFGVLIPAPGPGSSPTDGWFLFETEFFELRGAILITGRTRADFEVSRVRVEAEWQPLQASPVETTTFFGVEFSGLLFDPEDTGGFPVLPLRGHFRLTDSELEGVVTGSPLSELAQATVLVARNQYRSAIAIDVIDADRSQLAILSNRWWASVRGVQVLQNLDGRVSQASGFLVDDNVGSLAPFDPNVGDGIFFQDPFDASPVPGGSVLWATRNRLAERGGAGPAASGIRVVGSASLKLVDNKISGEAGVGVDVDLAAGCLVAGNSLRGLTAVEGPDLRLGFGTHRCLAVVGSDDVVQNDGTGNRVIRR